MKISESRERRATDGNPRLDVPYDEAFPSPEGFRWKTPKGWRREESTQFRNINFSFGEDGECYLSELPGMVDASDAAMLKMVELDNLNRWRGQMGQARLTLDDYDKLPAKPFLGGQAKFIDLTGPYQGAGGAPPKEGYRMLGLVLTQRGSTITVKMTGPEKLVAAEAGNFDAFCGSLRPTPRTPQ